MGDVNADLSGGPFHSTNINDPDSMSSPQAQMARQKSQEVMEALKKNDGYADKLMGKADNRANGNAVGGFRNWIKSKLGSKNGQSESHEHKPEKARGRKHEEAHGVEGLKGNSSGIGVEDSTAGLGGVASPQSGDILARDGGKGDGVIR